LLGSFFNLLSFLSLYVSYGLSLGLFAVCLHDTKYCGDCHGLGLVGNKGPRGHFITPPSAGVWRRKETKRQNSWVGIRIV